MKKTNIILALSAMLLSCFALNVDNNVLKANEVNDITVINTSSVETNAVFVDYNGSKTPIYGIQAYAGMNTNAWITGDVAPVVEKGYGSHIIGSNSNDGRSNFTLTFSVNSTVEGNAYLGLYGRFNNDSNVTYVVNGGEPVSANLKVYEWHLAVPTLLPITLVEGSNSITVTMCENYSAWFESFYISNTNEWLKDENGHNDTWFNDGVLQETDPVSIQYTGDATMVYGMQSYAGLKGPAWYVGEVAPVLDDGSKSHALGSNTGDRRSNLELSFAINSAVAGDVNLNVYAEIHDNGATTSNAKLDVNGEVSDINLYELNNNAPSSKSNSIHIPVTLVEGQNLIKIKMQENYEAWFCSWSITPKDVVILPKYNQINIGSWTNKQGAMGADQWAFGLNAFDNAADYGKTGSVDYVFTCETAGEYYLKFNGMAGHPLANRVKITVNDVVYTNNGKPYHSLDTSAGWSGYTPNTIKVSLVEGTNKITFENSLANLNSSKTEEVAEGTAGAVKVSNWYINSLTIERVPNEELIIDTNDAQTIYNINRAFSSEGLKVYHKVDEESTLLTSDQFTVDSSRYVSTAFGTYEIVVTMNNSSLRTSYYVNVGDIGAEFEGKTVDFDGTAMGKSTHSYYSNAKIEGEGTEECENRIFWYSTGMLLADGGYQFGSAGEGVNENRQVTLTITINSSVSGTYLFKNYVVVNDRNNSTINIKVNDEDAYDANMFYSNVERPYVFEVDLKEGINTITLKTYNKYNFWWNYFELAPIQYKDYTSYTKILDGVRWGKDIIDSDSNDIWGKTSNERSISFYYNFENAGNYLVKLNTSCSAEQNAIVYVDDTAYETTVVNGVTSIPVEVTSGNHTIKVYASGENSEFSMSGIQVVKDIVPVEIIIDTSNANLTIPYDGIFDSTTITAKMKYNDDSIVDLTTTEFKIVKDAAFDETKPGTYEFKVVYAENEAIFATFNVTVSEQEIEDIPSDTPSNEPSEDLSDEPIVSEPSVSEPSVSEPSDSTPEPVKKGCKGGIASSLISLISVAGALILLKKNK